MLLRYVYCIRGYSKHHGSRQVRYRTEALNLVVILKKICTNKILMSRESRSLINTLSKGWLAREFVVWPSHDPRGGA